MCDGISPRRMDDRRMRHFDDAVTRVFSNAPGNYGTNVNFMVMDSQWETEETLGDLFVTRKCFAYARDSQGRTIEGQRSAASDGQRAVAS